MLKNPYRIGLTGGIGAGKTTVAGLFAQIGSPILSADKIARELVKPGTPALTRIIEQFGSNVLNNTGELDRPLLRKLVFDDHQARKMLESILHPAIRQKIDSECNRIHAPYVVIEIPLLVESDQSIPVDRVLMVDSPAPTRIERIEKRDGMDRKTVLSIMQSQSADQERATIADDIILNNSDVHYLEKRVAELHKLYLELGKF